MIDGSFGVRSEEIASLLQEHAQTLLVMPGSTADDCHWWVFNETAVEFSVCGSGVWTK